MFDCNWFIPDEVVCRLWWVESYCLYTDYYDCKKDQQDVCWNNNSQSVIDEEIRQRDALSVYLLLRTSPLKLFRDLLRVDATLDLSINLNLSSFKLIDLNILSLVLQDQFWCM